MNKTFETNLPPKIEFCDMNVFAKTSQDPIRALDTNCEVNCILIDY